jgi:transposase-like protein
MEKTCPYCNSPTVIKNGSSYGVPKWKCKPKSGSWVWHA